MRVGGPVHRDPHCGNLAGGFHWGALEDSVLSPGLVIYTNRNLTFSYVKGPSLAVMILGTKQ